MVYILTMVVIVGFFSFTIFYQYFSLPQFVVPVLPEIKIPTKDDTILIIAPHCDDEVLGSAGLIYKSIQNGAKVIVVMITNGDGQYFGTMEEFRKIYPDANNYVETGNKRQEESINALQILGVPRENIIFLGYPDHNLKKLLTTNWNKPLQSAYTKTAYSPYRDSFQPNAPYTGANLERNLQDILDKYSPTLIIAPSKDDKNPDHFSTYEVEKMAIDSSHSNATLWTYLIHFDRFPYPSGIHRDKYLSPPNKLLSISDGWRILSLNDQMMNNKQQAILQYQSQLKIPLLNNLLISFIRKNELFKIVYW